MAAVGISSMPVEARDPLTPGLRRRLFPIVRPYLLATSQWQLWNLFSPDPLRRVSEHRIDRLEGGRWIPTKTWNRETIGFTKNADTFKLFERIEGSPLLWQRFLELQCTELLLRSGTPVRISQRSFILPQDDADSIGGWDHFEPQWYEEIRSDRVCP